MTSELRSQPPKIRLVTDSTPMDGHSRPSSVRPNMIRRRSACSAGRIRPGVVVALQVGVLIVLFGTWELGVRMGVVSEFFWSSPTRIWTRFVEQADAGTLWTDLQFTLTNAVVGFLIGTVVGTALGLSFWFSRYYARTVEPFVVAFEALPKLALAPIVILVLGVGIESKIVMAAIMVVAVQALNAIAGVRMVDQDIVRLFRSMGARKSKIFLSVVIPSTLPWLVAGVRVTIGLALAGSIVGEFIASQQGLGHLIVYASSVYDIALIWVGVFMLSIISIILYAIIGLIEKGLGIRHLSNL